MIDFSHKVRVFKKEELQSKLNNEGYVVLDFLHPEEVRSMLNFYNTSHQDSIKGFYTSTFSKDVEYRKKTDVYIRAAMQRGLESYFSDYKIHGSSFIVKGIGEKSELKLHQDMTLVDESKFTGINIWIPLIDLNNNNGAIALLPRSHRLYNTYRGATLPDIYDGSEEMIMELLKPLFLKAGQAVVFDQSIIHYSPPNYSTVIRPVINTFITHQDANIQICYWDKISLDEIEIFKQADDFMTNFQNFGHDIFSKPTIGESIGKVKYNFPKITESLLKKEYQYREKQHYRSFFRILKKLINQHE